MPRGVPEPTASKTSAPRERIDLSEAASLQVAHALTRPPRVVPELIALFTDEHDHDQPGDNTNPRDGSST